MESMGSMRIAGQCSTTYYGWCVKHGNYQSASPGCPWCPPAPPPDRWTIYQPITVTWPAFVPPVCTGTGTADIDAMPVGSGIKGEGRCGICGQTVKLSDGLHLVTHPYVQPKPETNESR